MHRKLTTAFAALCLSLPVVDGLSTTSGDLAATRQENVAAAPRSVAALDLRLLNPRPVLGAGATWSASTWGNAPLALGFRLEGPAPAPPAVSLAAVEPAPARIAVAIPLPVPRPADLGGPRGPSVASRNAVLPAPAEAEPPSLFGSLFGAKPAGPSSNYAMLDPGPLAPAPAPKISPVPSPAPATALYDISARTVTLPNGEVLEAHSGLGEHMDDSRYVHLRMRGATPPGTYELIERESRFHGVRAIRLNPVGGAGTIHNRAGLLAHTYLLGPNGQSNGCVSFRDYDRFLQAYLRGEVRRLVVVPGRGQDGVPGFFNRLFGGLAPRAPST